MPHSDEFLELSIDEATALIENIDTALGFGEGKPTITYTIPELHPSDPGIVLVRVERKTLLENPKLNRIIGPHRRNMLKSKPQAYIDAQKEKEKRFLRGDSDSPS